MNLSVTEARDRPAVSLTCKKLIRKAVKKVMSLLKRQAYVQTYSSPAELRNIARSCSRHGVPAARLPSERPGSVISVSKTFCLEYILWVPLKFTLVLYYNTLASPASSIFKKCRCLKPRKIGDLYSFWNGWKNTWWCVRSASHLTSLCLLPCSNI
jgi:hypothetical protein